MVPPPDRVILLEGIPGAITITATERVNNWAERFMRKFRKLMTIPDERCLNHLIKDYYCAVTDQLYVLKERHLLKIKISEHIYIFHLSFVDLQKRMSINTIIYLDVMEKLLCVVIDLDLEVHTFMQQKPVAVVSQIIINMLQTYLHGNVTRMLHVLLRISERYSNKQPYKGVMNKVYRYFLLAVPPINMADLQFCLYYILLEKWKRVVSARHRSELDKCFYMVFSKTPQAIKESRLMQKILKPNLTEITVCVEAHIRTDAISSQYFKYIEQLPKVVGDSNFVNEGSTKGTRKHDSSKINLHFVSHSLYMRALAVTDDDNNIDSSISVTPEMNDDVVIIEDDDDSDVEIVPVVQNKPSTPVPTVPMTLDIGISSVSTPKDASNRTVVSLDLSQFTTTLFNSIGISSKQGPDTSKDCYSLISSLVSNLEKSAKTSELTKFLSSLFEFHAKNDNNEKLFNVQNGKTADSKNYLRTQKLDTPTKPNTIEVANATTKDASYNFPKRDLQTSQLQGFEQDLNRQSSDKGVMVNNVRTTENVVNHSKARSSCNCPQSIIRQNQEERIQYREVEFVSKPSSKDAEMQTDNDIIITNEFHYRGIIETPPSDLDTGPYTSAADEYVKDDEFSGIDEFYNEGGDVPTKFGNSATQVYASSFNLMPDINEDDSIKIQDASFDGDNYSTVTIQNPSFVNEFVGHVHNNGEADNRSFSSMDFEELLKMPLELNDHSYEVTTQTITDKDLSNDLDLTDSSKNNQDLAARDPSPSPAYEVIPSHELRLHLREVKKRKRTGILKMNSDNNEYSESYRNSTARHNGSNVSLLRSPISTRAASKRKPMVHDEEVLPKSKKVNFADVDTVVQIPSKEPARRISHSIAEQAKDSMCLNNIHKYDSKLIFLEPCIPIQVMSINKIMDDHKFRQITTFNSNIDNFFIGKGGISVTDDPEIPATQRIDYKKFHNNTKDSTLLKSPPKCITTSLDSSYELGCARIRLFGDDTTKHEFARIREYRDKSKCNAREIKVESREFNEILGRQPRVTLTLVPIERLLISPKYGMGSSQRRKK